MPHILHTHSVVKHGLLEIGVVVVLDEEARLTDESVSVGDVAGENVVNALSAILGNVITKLAGSFGGHAVAAGCLHGADADQVARVPALRIVSVPTTKIDNIPVFGQLAQRGHHVM